MAGAPISKSRIFRGRCVFLFLFCLYFVGLQRGYVELRPWSDYALNRRLNAGVGAWLIQRLAPGEGVVAAGSRLASPRVTLDIMKGCEGFEVMVILAAAMLAYPAPWRKRLTGLAAGGVLIYSLNLARLVSLYFVARDWPAMFDTLHVVFWQSLLVCATAVIFLVWVRAVAEPRPGGAATVPPPAPPPAPPERPVLLC